MYPVATSPALHMALNMALDDEYRARASYQAVIDAFGQVTPFANIVQAEQRHIDAVLSLFERYGVMPPVDRWAGNISPPQSVQAACEAGVLGEIGNYQMYDRLLEQVSEPDVRMVFSNLRNASAFHHLPAFQACAGMPTQMPTNPASGAPVSRTLGTRSALTSIGLGLLAGAGAVWMISRLRRTGA